MIKWPDIDFPPVNLHSMPHQRNWPPQYLPMEANYVGKLMQEFYTEEDVVKRAILLSKIQNKREEFNRLWNARSRG